MKLFLYTFLLIGYARGLAPQSITSRLAFRPSESRTALGMMREESNQTPTTCWNPKLRRSMATIAGVGVLETGYLTINKLYGSVEQLCGTDGGCSSVLNGPYSAIPKTDVPLSVVGLAAYSTMFFLAMGPTLVSGASDDRQNRVLLTALATTMGVFSVFLMSLLFGVLRETCPFCIMSAILSIALAKIAWLGGALPEDRMKEGVATSTVGGLTAFAASVAIFLSGEQASTTEATVFAGSPTAPSTLLASSQQQAQSPPPITTSSSRQAMDLAKQMQLLDTRFFGAFWCSHCYDQKEAFGKEAMALIPYVECSRDGANSQTTLCKEKDVPGYPTWEINGKLYPGERDLDELTRIVQEARK